MAVAITFYSTKQFKVQRSLLKLDRYNKPAYSSIVSCRSLYFDLFI